MRRKRSSAIRGVELNQQAYALSGAGDFAGAEAAYVAALAAKRRVHAEDSVNICITLSNRADNLLEWAKAGGGGAAATSPRSLLAVARAEATHMLGIAQRLRSPDQARIARDILADVATAEAAAPPATPASERDPSLDSLAPRTSVAPLRGGGFSVVTEPVSRVCIPCGVGGTAALQLCGVCKRVYYCSKACQKSDWPAHRPTCKMSAGAAHAAAAKAAAARETSEKS